MLIVGDIGGTHSRLALVQSDDLEIIHEVHYPSQHYPSFEAVIDVFLVDQGREGIQGAAFALPGNVHQGVCRTTNLPWKEIRAEAIRQQFGWQSVFLLNDVEGHAWTLTERDPERVTTVFQGKKEEGNRCLLAPGTGLGEAGLVWTGSNYHVFASEGGHCNFAPTDPLQIELYTFLKQTYSHISYERLLSGPGLISIYQFLRDHQKMDEPAELKQRFNNEDRGCVITEVGMGETIEICSRAVDLFISILGAETGNCALKYMARGGVYLGGGIIPHLVPKLEGPLFKKSYLDKGRFGPLLQEISVSVIEDRQSCIRGAARYAAQKLRG